MDMHQVREHPESTISKVLTVIKWWMITTFNRKLLEKQRVENHFASYATVSFGNRLTLPLYWDLKTFYRTDKLTDKNNCLTPLRMCTRGNKFFANSINTYISLSHTMHDREIWGTCKGYVGWQYVGLCPIHEGLLHYVNSPLNIHQASGLVGRAYHW